jgi:cytochrome P450
VSIICKLLGVPLEDEPRFHQWTEIRAQGTENLIRSLDPGQGATDEDQQKVEDAKKQMDTYFVELIAALREYPGDNMLSGMIRQIEAGEPMSESELISTARLLLVAGHETTVRLITNGMLTMVRHPELLEQLRQDPELVISFVEELLRYDPPVQFRIRTALTDIEIAGTFIPKGASIALLLASGSHDASRFAEPERFMTERDDNQHLGFGSGIHYCVGAPLARLEAQIVLTELSRRLIAPTLAMDPPLYRKSAALRGPDHLLVNFAGLRD